ncbi:MAG: hypothetical protein U0441_16045 [Polyangiaceae bacterium]
MLEQEMLEEVHSAAVEALLHSRKALLAGIPKRLVGQLSDASAPAEQLLLDLNKLDEMGRLPDGSVPLERWLRNAWLVTVGKPEAQVFRRALEALVGPKGLHPKAGGAPLRLIAPRPVEQASLLQRVRKHWIDGFLHQSLQDELRIELGRTEKPDAVHVALAVTVERLDETEKLLDAAVPIGDYFRSRLQALLVLGEPGAGKTITLLELAEDLLDRAEEDPRQPMPVVLNLSSWAAQRQPIEEWAVEQLHAHYLIARSDGRAWIRDKQLAYLFDGLDEVKEPGAREACVSALNRFRRDHGASPIAVTCRLTEYEALEETGKLELDAAIRLRAITEAQLDAYFESAGPRLAQLRKLLVADEYLRELAKTPLMLNVMSLAHATGEDGEAGPPSARTGSLDEARRELFERYVDKMVRRHVGPTERTRDETLRSLIWLAREMLKRGQKVFLLEQLQPSSLAPGLVRGAYYVLTRVLGFIAFALLFGGLVAAGLRKHSYRLPSLDVLAEVRFPLSFGSFIVTGLLIGLLLGATDAWLGRDARGHRPRWSLVLSRMAAVLVSVAIPVAGLVLQSDALDDSLYRYWTMGILPGVLLVVFGLRSAKLSLGVDASTVESMRFRWRILAVAGVLLVGCPAMLALRFAARGTHDQRWTLPTLVPSRVPIEGDARFVTDNLVATWRKTDMGVSLFPTDTFESIASPFHGETWFSGDGNVALSVESKSFYSWSNASVYDRHGREWRRRSNIRLGPSRIRCGQLSPTGHRALARSSTEVWLIDMQSGEHLASFPGLELRLTTDGENVLVDAAGHLVLRSLKDGTEVLRLSSMLDTERLVDADIQPEEGWLAVLTAKGNIYRVPAAGGGAPSLLARLHGTPLGEMGALRFSPTGDRLAVAMESDLYLLDRHGRTVAAHARAGHWKRPFCLADRSHLSFSRDGGVWMENSDLRFGSAVDVYAGSDGAEIASLGPLFTGRSELSADGSQLLVPPAQKDAYLFGSALLLAFLGLPVTVLIALRPGTIDTKSRPNEGILLTARWSVIVSLGSAAMLAGLIAIAYALELVHLPRTAVWAFPLLFGLFVGLLYGGLDLLHHFMIRLFLAVRGELPFRSAAFLDSAARLIFLRKVGGGYMFIHDLVTAYFATDAERLLSKPKQEGPKNEARLDGTGAR